MSTRGSTTASDEDEVLVVRLTLGLLARSGGAIARAAGASRADVRRVRRALACAPHERRFARALLERRTNLWLIRTSQRAAAGDFLVIDVSPPRVEDRAVLVLELKLGERVRAVSPDRHQVRRARAAIAAAARATGAIRAEARMSVLLGDPDRLAHRLASR